MFLPVVGTALIWAAYSGGTDIIVVGNMTRTTKKLNAWLRMKQIATPTNTSARHMQHTKTSVCATAPKINIDLFINRFDSGVMRSAIASPATAIEPGIIAVIVAF